METQPLPSVRPKMRGFVPDWFHRGGHVMELEWNSKYQLKILGCGSKALVRVLFVPGRRHKDGPWEVSWRISFSYTEDAQGISHFSHEDLRAAFDVGEGSYDMQEPDRLIISRYGGDCARQGKFIRWKEYLNIPGPGTGEDGTPHVSIRLNDEICWAVSNLVEHGSQWKL